MLLKEGGAFLKGQLLQRSVPFMGEMFELHESRARWRTVRPEETRNYQGIYWIELLPFVD